MFTKDRLITSLFLLLSLVLVGHFVYVCIGWNVVVSLSDWKGLAPSYNIVGFNQYSKLFHDEVFLISLKNNLILILLFVPGTLFLGLFLAILLDLKVRGEGIFRGIYLLPFALSFVVTATLWAWMYFGEGVINTLLVKTGLEFLKSRWIGEPNIALYCVVLALTWQFAGYTMLIFLAGIRSIPESQIRAAEVDGASGFDLYRRVVIPQLKAPALSAFVVLMVFALKAFDFIFVLTEGGPGYHTYVLALMMFRDTFAKNQFAYGAAIATILFLLAVMIVVPYLYLSFRREKE